MCVNRSRSGIRASRARSSLETIGETIEGDKNNFIDQKLARGEQELFAKLSFSSGKVLTYCKDINRIINKSLYKI